MKVSQPSRSTRLPDVNAALAALLRFILTTTQTDRGSIRVLRNGTTIYRAAMNDDDEAPDSSAYHLVRDVVHVPLTDAEGSEAIVALVRRPGQREAVQLSSATIELLASQIVQVLDAQALAQEYAALRSNHARPYAQDAFEPRISIDAHAIVRSWNAAATAEFGPSSDEAIGKALVDVLVPPELRERYRPKLENFAQTGRSDSTGHQITLPALRRDGTPMFVELRVSVSHSVHDQVTLYGLLHDVTELEQTRERLTRSENLLREAQQIVGIGCYEHDLTNGTVLCSDELFRIFGLDKTTFDGTAAALRARFHPDDVAAASNAYYRAIGERRPHEFEARIVRSNGETAIVLGRGRAVFDVDGKAVRVYATLADITEERHREAERLALEIRCTQAFDHAPFGMSMIDARTQNFGIVLRVNAAHCELLGQTQDRIIGKSFTTFVDPQDTAVSIAATDLLIGGEVGVIRREIRMIRNDATVIWVREIRSLMRDARGDALYFLTFSEDVTQSRIDQAALAEANARLRRSLDNAPIGMALTTIGRTSPGHFIEVNPALCRLSGFSRAELLEMSFTDLLHPAGRQHSAAAMEKLVSGQEAFCTFEERYVRADASYGWIAVHASVAYDNSGHAMYCITQMMDISKRKAAEGKLEHFAYHDALTGVFNRRGLALEMKHRFIDCRADTANSALLLLDLDHFKHINDTLGHSAGDRLLKRLARVLRATCRADDIIARLGGDEFVVIATDVNEQAAVGLADKLRTVIAADVQLGNESKIALTASIGIVLTDSLSGPSIDETIAAADSALLKAKRYGRNRSFVAPFVHSVELRTPLTWSQRLCAALECDGFELYLQPIRDLRSGRVKRYEVLLRMIGPDGSCILPEEFLPAAERAGLMPEIDCWVIRQTIARAAFSLQAEPDVIFEINLSGASLTSELIVPCIERELQSSGLEPRTLVFEIAETDAIAKLDRVGSVAEKIAAIGCAIALADFGAGFASLYFLKYVPLDYLKIDAEFTRNVRTNITDQHIVKAIVDLAQSLDMKTVAEFVGDAATAAYLSECGVDFAQGSYIGKAEPWDVTPGGAFSVLARLRP